MEKGDIAPTVHKHIACWFEDLLITRQEEPPKRRFFRREKELTDDEWVKQEVRRWRVNEMPLKSVYHMVNQLDLGVEVYTYYEDDLVDSVEHWLARKGINVSVYAYPDLDTLIDDFKYNRDVHTLFTPYEEDAAILGFRATVALSDGTFGI
ncbi:MAG: hypothetical protein EB168_07725 [Euryarchaeota archaeon]|nr:hypothetical protein [Euryarchaeota archaeon]